MFYYACVLTIPETGEVMCFGRWYSTKQDTIIPKFINNKAERVMKNHGGKYGYIDCNNISKKEFEKLFDSDYNKLYRFIMNVVKMNGENHSGYWKEDKVFII